MAEIFSNTNGAIAELAAGGITIGNTKIKFVDASKIPAAFAGTGALECRIIVDSEIMMVTNRNTTTEWTVTRAIEGTTAASHAAKAFVFHKLTAGAIEGIITKITGGVSETRAREIAAEEATKTKSTPVVVTSLPYTFKASDEGKTIEIEVSSGTSGQVIIPKNIFPVGAEWFLTQTGTTKVEVVGETTFTEVKIPVGLHPKTDARWSTLSFRRTTGSAPEKFVVAGDLEI